MLLNVKRRLFFVISSIIQANFQLTAMVLLIGNKSLIVLMKEFQKTRLFSTLSSVGSQRETTKRIVSPKVTASIVFSIFLKQNLVLKKHNNKMLLLFLKLLQTTTITRIKPLLLLFLRTISSHNYVKKIVN